MSEIEAKIIEDSINENGNRLTTFVLKYPRFILAELNTHRVFSRNSASSRAIPLKKMIEQVRDDPVFPVFWGKNQPGMQSKEELTGEELRFAKTIWLKARDEAVKSAQQFAVIEVHKQIANRILEPWMWTYTVLTATDFSNFYSLRLHPDAQPEIKVLAEKMLEAHENSKPRLVLGTGACDLDDFYDWHLPFVTAEERKKHSTVDLLKFSVARCARVSYANHEGTVDLDKDRSLHDKLVESGHMSPSEHQAIPNLIGKFANTTSKYMPIREGNFVGWKQYRKFIVNENRIDFKIKSKG